MRERPDGAGDSPRVSVITITRNDCPNLVRTRTSVQSQTYRQVEHVVVDAASADGTSEWLQENAEGLVWVSEADEGRYEGMNKGARLASGQLLWFLHAGDVFSAPNVVECVVRSWRERRWRWAYGAARLVTDGRVMGINAPIPFRFRRFALGEAVLPHQAACFERSLFADLGGYDETFGLAADQLFMLKAALVSRPETIPEFLCDFELGGAGSNRNPFWHYYDAARARRHAGAVGGVRGGLFDAVLALVLATSETAKRGLAGRLRLNR